MGGPEAENVYMLTPGESCQPQTLGQVFLGEVISYNPQKGWGFVSCLEAKRIYQKDIFLHQDELAGNVPSVGQQVQFAVKLRKDGCPQATNVVWDAGGYGPAVAVAPATAMGCESGVRAAPY